MGRLFAGTPFDRPPRCERCGMLESECACLPVVPEPLRIPPEKQTARLRVEKRPRGKLVTVVANLDPNGNDLPALVASLKNSCGAGGTLKEGLIEIQGDHLSRVQQALESLGYRTRRG